MYLFIYLLIVNVFVTSDAESILVIVIQNVQIENIFELIDW